MKAISLWQPWASLMAVGAKTIETRHWPTDYRGPLAIHAAKRKVLSELDELWAIDAFREALLPETIGIGSLADALPFGAIVCVVDVYRCEKAEVLRNESRHWISAEEHFGNYEAGRFGWLTRYPQKLKTPVATRGFQGFWNLPPEVELQIGAQL